MSHVLFRLSLPGATRFRCNSFAEIELTHVKHTVLWFLLRSQRRATLTPVRTFTALGRNPAGRPLPPQAPGDAGPPSVSRVAPFVLRTRRINGATGHVTFPLRVSSGSSKVPAPPPFAAPRGQSHFIHQRADPGAAPTFWGHSQGPAAGSRVPGREVTRPEGVGAAVRGQPRAHAFPVPPVFPALPVAARSPPGNLCFWPGCPLSSGWALGLPHDPQTQSGAPPPLRSTPVPGPPARQSSPRALATDAESVAAVPCPGGGPGLGSLPVPTGGQVPLTVLHLGAQLALFGVLEDGVVAGLGALHGTVAAGLVKEGAVPTRGRAAGRGRPSGPVLWPRPEPRGSGSAGRGGGEGLPLQPPGGGGGGRPGTWATLRPHAPKRRPHLRARTPPGTDRGA